jgi:predicted DNA-binding protein with PD1-like motif
VLETLPLRLRPGDDLQGAIERHVTDAGVEAAFVVAGMGSLSTVRLRFAGVPELATFHGDFEILTLSGTLSPDGAHLHASVSDADGRVLGGHVGTGNIVRTTAEVLVAVLPTWSFSREDDPETGYDELVVRPTRRT